MGLYFEIGLKNNIFSIKIILNKVLYDLRKVKIFDKHILVSYNIILLNSAYVLVTKKGIKDITRNMIMLNHYNIYSIGRYDGWKYCSKEDNINEAKNIANKIKTLINKSSIWLLSTYYRLSYGKIYTNCILAGLSSKIL